MIKSIDIHTIMNYLALHRPIFHSEADFQFALAWELNGSANNLGINNIRLEKSVVSSSGNSNEIDILLSDSTGLEIPIELKYKTQEKKMISRGEVFDLKNHGARDVGGYLFIKDIARIEDFKRNNPGFGRGFALFMTNDLNYTKDSGRQVCYEDFKVNHGRVIPGNVSLTWKGPLVDWQKSKPPIKLDNSYRIDWKTYSPGFAYTLVEIN